MKTLKDKSGTNLDFYQAVTELLRGARTRAHRAVNFAMVEAYWNVGRMIVEEEQRGKERAEYGAVLIKNLSGRLTEEFGKGFTESNLWNFRQFYLTFPDGKLDALRRELTWTHYRLLMRVENPDARMWYLKEAADQNWSTRALERQIHSLYHERLRMSKNKEPVIEEMQQRISPLASTPRDFIKEPYVLEFLGIPDTHEFRENELEQAIIFENSIKSNGDNPTVGLILCTEKDHTVVKYSVLNESQQLFASKYRLYLPSEEELQAEIARERDLVVRKQRVCYG